MARSHCLLIAALLSIPLSHAAIAQSSTTYSGSNMWGTTPGGIAVTGAYESASTHSVNGSIAGMVNAARKGYLINTGGTTTIEAIGSETIVSSSVYGNNDTVSVTASQSSSNTGPVTNTGNLTGH